MKMRMPAKKGSLLLAIWLVVTGLLVILDVANATIHNLNAILAIAAGVLIFLDR